MRCDMFIEPFVDSRTRFQHSIPELDSTRTTLSRASCIYLMCGVVLSNDDLNTSFSTPTPVFDRGTIDCFHTFHFSFILLFWDIFLGYFFATKQEHDTRTLLEQWTTNSRLCFCFIPFVDSVLEREQMKQISALQTLP